MEDVTLQWRTNLRTNLGLWPEVTPNIEALALLDGEPYDEDALLARFPQREGKTPTTSRTVRNTFEIVALSGLGFRTEENQFSLTPLGHAVFRFLGVVGGRRIANPDNIDLLGRHLVRGLCVVAEYRAIWSLMRATENLLTNEELNRAMARLATLGDIPETAEAILEGRRRNPKDPTVIGPRLYREEDYGTPQESDQRKVMHVHFLLAGGGGTIISTESDERRLARWAIPLIDRQIASVVELIHATTDPDSVLRISDAAGVPYDVLPRL